MTKDVLTCSIDEDIEDVLRIMAEKGIRHMPVVENGRLAGVLARRDALEFLYQQTALDVESLSEWLFHTEARY
jgi:predicted transcriptional regulator